MKIEFKTSMLLILLIALSVGLQAQQAYRLMQNDSEKIELRLNSTTLTSVEVKTDAGYFSRIVMDQFHSSVQVGDPELPTLVKLVEIPLCDDIELHVTPGDFVIYDAADLNISYPVFPAQPSYEKSYDGPIDLIKNTQTYQQDQFFAATPLVTVNPIGQMRDQNLAELTFSPVSYNPVTQQLKVYQSVDVEIRFVNSRPSETAAMKRVYHTPMMSVPKSLLVNPAEPQRAEWNHNPIKMVIVSHPMFETQLAPFIEWKKRKGFIVDLALTNNPSVGSTTTSIKNYLKALYDNATETNPAPTFVLFVGDVAQVPTFSGTEGSHVTDLYYVTFTTGDHLPDAYYGRFSATNASELAPQLEKTLMYEMYTMPDPSYLDDAVLVAGYDSNWSPTHANGQVNYLANNYINTGYGYSNIYKHLHPCSAQAALIRQQIGNGVGYANYSAHCGPTGWGDPSFENHHVPAMNNEGKYGLIIGNCCQSGMFDNSVCFGEALLRADKKGAVAYIGASNNTYWNEDFYWSVGYRSSVTANPVYQSNNLGAYDRLFHTHNETHSEWMVSNMAICHAGNLGVQSSSSSASTKKYYWEVYHLFGDPSVITYLTQADEMDVSAPAVLTVGANSISLTAAPYAYVALVKEGVLIGANFADATGSVTLTFDPLTEPGEYELAAWGQNYQQYFETINVIVPSGAYVVASTAALMPGYQPYINSVMGLNLVLSNLGVANASGVYATLSTNSPYINIINDSVYVGNLNQGGDIDLSEMLSFQVTQNFPNRTTAELQVNVHSSDNNSLKKVVLQLLSPELEYHSVEFAELTGNGNQLFDAGEEVNVKVKVKNVGKGTLFGLRSNLISFTSQAVVEDDVQWIESITSDQIVTVTYKVTLGENLEAGDLVPLHFKFYKGEFEVVQTLHIPIGLVCEDFETGDFTKFPWVNTYNPWEIVSANVYAGTYAAKSKTGLSNNSSSVLQITMQAHADGNISYYRRVSSEANYDKFTFYIDGEAKETVSGNQSYQMSSFPVTAGTHVYKFEYKKDVSVSNGSDCVWIENIVFPAAGNIIEEDLPILEMTSHDWSVGGVPVNRIPLAVPAQLSVQIKNVSVYTAHTPQVTLTTHHPDVEIIQGASQQLSDLESQATANVDFTVKSNARGVILAPVDFVLKIVYDDIDIEYPLSVVFEEISMGVCQNYDLNCNVYPIPTQDVLTIESEKLIETIQCTDISGRTLFVTDCDGVQETIIDISRLATGVYFLTIKAVDQTQQVQKVIKK